VIQKVMVVNDCRKVSRLGWQVRVEKRSESEPSEDASKTRKRCQNRGRTALAGRAGRAICLPTQRQPVYRRPELNSLASTAEHVNSDWWCVGKRQVMKVMRRNTDTPVSGGAIGTSVEAPVMGVEQSGGVVRSRLWVNSVTRTST
jgi:hypothetical protein